MVTGTGTFASTATGVLVQIGPESTPGPPISKHCTVTCPSTVSVPVKFPAAFAVAEEPPLIVMLPVTNVTSEDAENMKSPVKLAFAIALAAQSSLDRQGMAVTAAKAPTLP